MCLKHSYVPDEFGRNIIIPLVRTNTEILLRQTTIEELRLVQLSQKCSKYVYT